MLFSISNEPIADYISAVKVLGIGIGGRASGVSVSPIFRSFCANPTRPKSSYTMILTIARSLLMGARQYGQRSCIALFS